MKSKISLISFVFFISIAVVANASGMNRVVLKQSDAKGNKDKLKQEMFYNTIGGKRTPNTNTIFVI